MDLQTISSIVDAVVRTVDEVPGGQMWSVLFALCSAAALMAVFRCAVRA